MKMKKKNQQLRVKGKNVFLRYVTLDDFDEMMEMFRESRKFYKGLINPPLISKVLRFMSNEIRTKRTNVL